MKEILRHTPKDHPDVQLLEKAILIIQGVLSDINVKKGESECQYYIDKLEYLEEKQKDPRIESSKVLLCHGELKNKNGHKLHIFLFQDILVLTRPVTRNERHSYQVYRQPIPVQELVLEDLQDGDVRMGGSFRGLLATQIKLKTFSEFASKTPVWASPTLQANDVPQAAVVQLHPQCHRPFPAGHWPSELHQECRENPTTTSNARAQRQASMVSSMTQGKADGDAAECGAPVHTADHTTGMKAPRAQTSLRKARDRAQVGGKRKETLV